MDKKTKNKFVNSIQVDWSSRDLFKDLNPDDYKDIDLREYDQAYAQTSENKIIQCFLYLKEGKPYVIPEPEPSLMFFKNAENKIESILNSRDKVIASMKIRNVNISRHLFGIFFSSSFDYIINLFALIEAFNNAVIPEKYEFREKRKLYNREKIQKFISFEKKVRIIIPEVFEKSFIYEFNDSFLLIEKLRKSRNNLIHTKNHSNNWQASYRNIYRNILDFEYYETYHAVKDYMNYYKENWIQEE